VSGLIDELRQVPGLADLTDEQLAWFASHGTIETYESGEDVFQAGADADHMTIVLDGAVEILFAVSGQLVPALVQRKGALTGVLPFSRMRTYGGSGRASGYTRLFQLNQSHFDEMLRVAPVLGPRLVSMMTDRVREGTRLAQQREKMMALGKLSAGLAHELNNPAAAVRRNADALTEQLAKLPQLTRAMLDEHVGGDVIARAEPLVRSTRVSAPSGVERSRREQAIGSWLDQAGVPDSWLFVDVFVDAGLRPDDLRAATDGLTPAVTASLVVWAAAVIGARRLSDDIHAAAARISELVTSIKVYSHMDRSGNRERFDVREGIDSTLVMLGHKLKRKQITLERHYADDLPPIDGFPGELNQVWTNLIDNAIDAMDAGGVLRIETQRDGSMALVRVIDNGTGIAPEIKSRIFEAFFTTKPIGEGTGLGLDIVQHIVAQQHGGRVDVESIPGRTVFTVALPIDSNG